MRRAWRFIEAVCFVPIVIMAALWPFAIVIIFAIMAGMALR